MSNKLERISNISEDEFRTNVLMPLIKKMGYENIRLNHGSREYGKDIIFSKPDIISTINIAVVAKVGDITGKSGGNDTNIIRTIKDQVEQSFEHPFEDVAHPDSPEIYMNQVYVWTTGKIGENAQRRIKNELKSDYKNNITFLDGARTIELLENFYSEFFTLGDAGIVNYFNSAKTTYSKLEELYAIGGSQLLPAIFVSPTLERIPKLRSKQARKEGLPNRRYSLAKSLDLKGNLFLVGEMGSGKSAILRRILISSVEKNQHELNEYPIPILLRFKNLTLNSSEAIKEALSKEYYSHTEINRDLISDLERGNILLLMDGLDELETDETITDTMNALKQFLAIYPKTRTIATSRMLDIFHTSNLLSSFIVLKIMDFSPEQMKELIRKWFGLENPEGKQLIKLISEPMAMSTIPFTPLTLALVAILYHSGIEDLPASLTELFEKYTELCLGRWDIVRDVRSQIDWKKKHLSLRNISWKMISDKTLELSDFEIRSSIVDSIESRGLEVDRPVFFKEIFDRSGLLVKNHDGNYEFKHRAFLDYFVGGELNTKKNSVDLVVEKFVDQQWSRAIFFACGLDPENKGEKYLEAIMENIKVEDCGAFHYAFQLGLLSQATYLARQSTKVKAVETTLWSFIKAWDEFVLGIREIQEKRETSKPFPHRFLVFILSALIKASIGSSTLSLALQTLSQQVIYPSEVLVIHSQVERKKYEWYVFALAISCANANLAKPFIQLFESGTIIDPFFLQVGIYDAEILIDSEMTNGEEKLFLKDLLKDLKKKVKSSGDYIDRVGDQLPLLITETANEQ